MGNKNDILSFGKVPPQCPDLEAAVLGGCLLDKSIWEDVVGILSSEDCFYVDAHQKIFAAMKELSLSGNAIDLLTVTNELRKNNNLELVGGAGYLAHLTTSVLTTAHTEAHCRIVMEKFLQRELIRVCMQTVNQAYEDSADVFDLLDDHHAQYTNVTELVSGGSDQVVGKVYIDLVQDIDFQRNNDSVLTGIDTGLLELNVVTNGWQNTDLIIIGGRPSKGKTALGLNLALNAAITEIVKKRNVGIFSLEMGNKQLLQRLASTVTKIPFDSVRRGKVSEFQFKELTDKINYFSKLPIRIDDKTFTFIQICAKARKWKKRFDIGLIVVDYLQLIIVEKSRTGNREQEISKISRGFKLLAKELEIPIILLSQLNRDVEKRKPQEPMLSDLRESGAIEQDADIVIFPWHDVNEWNEFKNYITVAKNRNGTLGRLEVKFFGGVQEWRDATGNPEFLEAQRNHDNPMSGIRTAPKAAIIPEEDVPF